jgi:hypothetical protein
MPNPKMKLKNFFLSLTAHGQTVEVYFTEENRDGTFGFKINQIDSEEVLELNEGLFFLIQDEIRKGFIDSSLILNGEGDTSYLLQSDSSCIKTAKYFSWVHETEQFWIQENLTEYYLEDIVLPLDLDITITKAPSSFKISEQKKLKALLTKQQYEEFASFYKELLSEFQEMEIELQLDDYDDTGTEFSILSMSGSYQKNLVFDLLDASHVLIPKDELQTVLTMVFKIDEVLAHQILHESEGLITP